MKIDIEGCEVPILKELLVVVPNIDFIYCEYHDDDDRHTIDSPIQNRFVLGGASASKPHQGMCVYWSRETAEALPVVRRHSQERGLHSVVTAFFHVNRPVKFFD